MLQLNQLILKKAEELDGVFSVATSADCVDFPVDTAGNISNSGYKMDGEKRFGKRKGAIPWTPNCCCSC